MNRFRPIFLTLITAFLCTVAIASANEIYIPIVITPPQEEFRGLWVSRFDWTSYNTPASPDRIDTIVENAAAAGFNAIFFQVRGTADAYYTPGLEPWAQRVSGNFLGEWPTPYWDPLAHFIEKAHANGIELHAYMNIYPAWDCNSTPSASVLPKPLYHQLIDQYGTHVLSGTTMVNGLQKLDGYNSQCLGGYQRTSPASIFFDNHILAVAQDLVNRYDIDGIHLDHIRYAGRSASCDSVSLCRYNGESETCSTDYACNLTDDYKDWQRRQVNGTVRKFYEELALKNPDLWLSAAVWPIHTNKWGWNASQGNLDYYQDSKAWVQGGYIDSISPMIYANTTSGCPEDPGKSILSTRSVWLTLVADFQAESGGRHIVPGIGASFCDFEEIAWRIEQARAVGTAGHALFSYGYLETRSFFDDLRNGPYSEPAVVPNIPWH
ncbi:MAG: glycoside hydrolase family 10 protein [Candidatus Promineifilaceae bacterium]